MEQSYFNYNLKPGLAIDDFFVSTSNKNAYNFILDKNLDNKKILLIGPNKSGKTHLGKIWQKKNNNKITFYGNYKMLFYGLNQNNLDIKINKSDQCIIKLAS